jgi:hypothetical protein
MQNPLANQSFHQQMPSMQGAQSVMTVPVLDEEGKPVIDENGQPQFTTSVMGPSQMAAGAPGLDPLNVTHGSSTFNTQNQFF